MYEWIIFNGYHPVIITTKLDKINCSQAEARKDGAGRPWHGKGRYHYSFSAETKQGRDEDMDLIEGSL